MCGYVPAGLDCSPSISQNKAFRTGRPSLILGPGARSLRAQRDRVYRSASSIAPNVQPSDGFSAGWYVSYRTVVRGLKKLHLTNVFSPMTAHDSPDRCSMANRKGFSLA